ncbi:hypothetical protein N0V83_009596 [Neocucurbitaria cava]|uniref:PRISE-like Rossmann-fold domain-containing protein n=1 Tax=Neocucurbitaria cava TaxID=798079 RepID=A0A9W9CIF7_9PLEO|nr:hypothetical protein N0V83_009596 [Neocucurbitaria cava]
MADQLPVDYLKTVPYLHYRAMLTEESANKDWSWSEVVPDAIIGFTPSGSGFSLAGHWAGYHQWVAIFASLNPENFKKRIFNVADSATPESMRERWAQNASFFGLKGVPPLPAASASDPKPSDFIKQHEEEWKKVGIKGVDIWNAAQLDSYGYWLTFDRHLSLQRLRDAGFDEENRPEEGWWETFKMFRRAGMIL